MGWLAWTTWEVASHGVSGIEITLVDILLVPVGWVIVVLFLWPWARERGPAAWPWSLGGSVLWLALVVGTSDGFSAPWTGRALVLTPLLGPFLGRMVDGSIDVATWLWLGLSAPSRWYRRRFLPG